MFPETALVTGGRSGIGRALVERLEAERTSVQVLDLADGVDVGDPAVWDGVGPVELACLNAGVVSGAADVRELTLERYRRVVATNCDGVALGVSRLARVMEPGGAIVVTASLAGLTTMARDPLYAATKHFVVGFVRSAAPQLAELGLRIAAVCPGIVDTPMLGAAREQARASGFELIAPDEVAEAVLAAAHDDSTGECWVCLPGRPPERHVFHRFFETA